MNHPAPMIAITTRRIGFETTSLNPHQSLRVAEHQ
jgi:hypothetical protein